MGLAESGAEPAAGGWGVSWLEAGLLQKNRRSTGTEQCSKTEGRNRGKGKGSNRMEIDGMQGWDREVGAPGALDLGILVHAPGNALTRACILRLTMLFPC